jgi:hypothetical protein
VPTDRGESRSVALGAAGTAAWLVLAAVPWWWARNESDMGNRAFLYFVAVIALGFAVWRGVATYRAATRRPPDLQD